MLVLVAVKVVVEVEVDGGIVTTPAPELTLLTPRLVLPQALKVKATARIARVRIGLLLVLMFISSFTIFVPLALFISALGFHYPSHCTGRAILI